MNIDDKIIQTRFLEGQGLGNQLWVYAVGRALAEKYGRRHIALGGEFFKGRSFLDVNMLDEGETCAPVAQFHEFLYYDPLLKYFCSTYDSRVECLPSRVQINGLFQSEKYLYGQNQNLSKWIQPRQHVIDMAKKFKEIGVINLRGGEYKRHKSLILPRSYWDRAVDILRQKFPSLKIVLVTDDPAYAKAFLPEYPVLKGGIAECYGALMGAKAVVVSNSSFAYFPLKTREDCPFVIAPEHWARYGHLEKRWAMPANVYKDWNYLGEGGSLLSYEVCQNAADRDALYYESMFNLRIPFEESSKVAGIKMTKFIPKLLKKKLRSIASNFFPLWFG